MSFKKKCNSIFSWVCECTRTIAKFIFFFITYIGKTICPVPSNKWHKQLLNKYFSAIFCLYALYRFIRIYLYIEIVNLFKCWFTKKNKFIIVSQLFAHVKITNCAIMTVMIFKTSFLQYAWSTIILTSYWKDIYFWYEFRANIYVFIL